MRYSDRIWRFVGRHMFTKHNLSILITVCNSSLVPVPISADCVSSRDFKDCYGDSVHDTPNLEFWLICRIHWCDISIHNIILVFSLCVFIGLPDLTNVTLIEIISCFFLSLFNSFLHNCGNSFPFLLTGHDLLKEPHGRFIKSCSIIQFSVFSIVASSLFRTKNFERLSVWWRLSKNYRGLVFNRRKNICSILSIYLY